MENKLVSVVVPIYKVEKYLNCCIESIVSQTYRNLEILLIDDGSPDYCPKICDDWAQRDSRIHVIHKENQGLGMARNTGIDHATGEYICFFDSDDYVDKRTIEKAYQKAEQYDADIVLFGIKVFDDEGNNHGVFVPEIEKEFFSGEEIQNEFLQDVIDSSFSHSRSKNLPLSACSCLFSMNLIRKSNWRFVSEREIISEDSYSLIALYKNVRRVYVLCEALYYYRKNMYSLSRSFREDRFEKTKDFYLKTSELMETYGYQAEVKNRLKGLFFNFSIDIMKQIVCTKTPLTKRWKAVRDVVYDHLLHECLKDCRYNINNTAKYFLHKCVRMRLSIITYLLIYIKTIKW